MHQSLERSETVAFKCFSLCITPDTYEENIKFIVRNLWIQIYDKDSFFGAHTREGLAGYLWLTICAHNTDEKCMNVIISEKELKIKLCAERKTLFDR